MGEQAQVADISEPHFEEMEDFPEFSEPLDGKPLLFMYDCESTGGSIYQDHIVEMAAVVLAPDDVIISETSFSQLCKTSLPISTVGNNIILLHLFSPLTVKKKCGICNYLPLNERPFDAVFPEFLRWVEECLKDAGESTDTSFYPGTF